LSTGAKAIGAAKSIGSGAKAALATNAAVRELYANMSASQALAEIAKALVRGGQAAGITQELLNPIIGQTEENTYPMTAYGMPMLPQ
jgi:spore maturation protein SpmB